MQAAVNLGAPVRAAAGAAATSCSPAFSRSGRSAEPSSASFQIELQAAVLSQATSSLLGGPSASQASLQDGTGNRLLRNADTAGDGAGEGAGEAVAVLPTADMASFLLRLLQTIAAVQAGTNSSADIPVGLSEPAHSEAGASPIPARVLELFKQLETTSAGAEVKAGPGDEWLAGVLETRKAGDSPIAARILELFKQLETSSAGAGVKVDLEDGGLAGVLEKVEGRLDSNLTKTLDSKTHQPLSELPGHRAGVDWKQTVIESTGTRLQTPIKSDETGVLREKAESAEMTLTQNALNRPDATRVGVLHVAETSTPGARDENAGADPSIPARGEGVSAKSLAPASAAAEPPVSPHSATFLAAAGNTGEGRQGGKNAQPLHMEAAAPDTVRSAAGLRTEQDADGAGSFQRSTDPSLLKQPVGGEAAAGRNLSAAEAFETNGSEVRLPHAHETGSEKSATAPAAAREKEPVDGSLRTGLFDQIVKRAVVQIRNDQGEVKIDLKPEFLGNVRMQILTENQQVSVRILTELPAVRDMLEAGLQQLKSELQNQGLHVDRLEVSVSDDPHKQSQRRTQPEQARKTTGIAGVSSDGQTIEEDRLEMIHSRPWSTGYGTIDMFA